MKRGYEGKMYRRYTVENFCKWAERLRFVWGKDAIITITDIEKGVDDSGGFSYRIDYEVSDGTDFRVLEKYSKDCEKLMLGGIPNAN